MNPEAAFFSSLLRGDNAPPDLRRIEKHHLTTDYQMVYDYILGFVQQYGKLPRAATVEGDCRVTLPPAPEGVAFYAKQVLDNALRFDLDVSLTEKVAQPLSQADPHGALAGLSETLSGVRSRFSVQHRGLVLPDMRERVHERLNAYHIRAKAAQLRVQLGLPTPWPALTRQIGGLLGVWYILARPNVGKTWLVLMWAVYLWQLGYDVFVCSMETPPEDEVPEDTKHRVIGGWCRYCYEQGVSPHEECPAASVARQRLSIRLDALAARISPWRFLNGCLTPLEYQRLVHYYTYMEQGAPLWGRLKIVGAPHIRSISDYELEARAFNGDIGLIDSAYLLARAEDEGRMTERATSLVIEHKQVHTRLGVPGVVSWHFNADVAEDALRAQAAKTIMYTDEVNRVSDGMLGLFRPPDLQTSGEAIARTLKVRDGLALRELRFYFRVKEELNFAEIADSPLGKGEDS